MLASSAQKNTGATPGPWRVEDVGFPPGHLAIMAGSSTEYRWLATVGEDLKAGIDWTQTQANARLIAAAPRMLDLLERLLDTALPSSTLRVPNYIVVAIKDVLREVSAS